jgi:hypothetical protein
LPGRSRARARHSHPCAVFRCGTSGPLRSGPTPPRCRVAPPLQRRTTTMRRWRGQSVAATHGAALQTSAPPPRLRRALRSYATLIRAGDQPTAHSLFGAHRGNLDERCHTLWRPLCVRRGLCLRGAAICVQSCAVYGGGTLRRLSADGHGAGTHMRNCTRRRALTPLMTAACVAQAAGSNFGNSSLWVDQHAGAALLSILWVSFVFCVVRGIAPARCTPRWRAVTCRDARP